MDSKIGIGFMEYDEEFLFCFFVVILWYIDKKS